MISENIDKKITDLFLKKKYGEVIKISKEYTAPYKRNPSLANLIGISILYNKNLTENNAKSALDCFVETYENDKIGEHGLNGIYHLITVSIQLFKEYKSVQVYTSLSKKYYLEAEKNFEGNDKFLTAGYLLFKHLLDHKKLKKIIDQILNGNSQSKILRSWRTPNNTPYTKTSTSSRFTISIW